MNYSKELFHLHPEVEAALRSNQPVLALESTIISHGMPYPQNLKFAKETVELIRQNGVAPATVAIANGKVRIGLDNSLLELLSSGKNVEKVAVRDLGTILTKRGIGATTVSATLHLAWMVGIPIFATGGIGGVHRGAIDSFDVSQDLKELGHTPVIVISAGAKAILDIPKTLEVLETEAVPVIGYRTNEFPAFYSRQSGSKVTTRVESPEEIVEIFRICRKLKLPSGLLVANPIPTADEIPVKEINTFIKQALIESKNRGISGKEITPFLLSKIAELSDGRSLKANISLALNNVRLGIEIAREICRDKNNLDYG